MVKKKTTRKKAATKVAIAPCRTMLITIPEDLFIRLAEHREVRKANRLFPWTVRDCMTEAIEDYLNKMIHGIS